MVSRAQRRKSLKDKRKKKNKVAPVPVLKSLLDDYYEEKLEEKCDDFHVKRRMVTVRNCGRSLKVGIDIRFDSSKVNTLDGNTGVATIYHITPNSPADRAGVLVGDRILSIFNFVAHSKQEFYEIFAKQRKAIAGVHLPRSTDVVMCCETPCSFAAAEAQKSAKKFIEENRDSRLLDNAGFKCRCISCNDTVTSRCRDFSQLFDKCSQKHGRRHTISEMPSKSSPTISKKCPTMSKTNKFKYDILIHSDSFTKKVSVGSASGSKSDTSNNKKQSVELKTVFSFTDLANRDRSGNRRRMTVS